MEHTTPEHNLPEHAGLEPTGSAHAGPSLHSYYKVYGALLALLALTVLASFFDGGGALAIIIALIIAVTKAVLVVLYFMHLRYSSRLTWVFAGVGFAWLMILFAGLIADYISRGWVGQ